MADEFQLCPNCEEDLSQSGELDLAFCPSCRFPMMLIAGKYRLEKTLAEGGFGFVYLARHEELGTQRVIKVIKPEVFVKESVSSRFRREVQITSTLSEENDHIVRIFDDFGEQPKFGHYYVMEHLKGKTLKGFLAKVKGPLPVPLALHIFRQLCLGMEAAHEAGIIHRDLKPDNLFLIQKRNDNFFLKIIDFGISKPTEGGTDLTKGVIGTPQYMAPEQCAGKAVSPQTDIYAMGLILYEMLSGRAPFSIEIDETMGWIMAQLSNEPLDFSVSVPSLGLPDQLSEAVLCALAKSPSERYPDVSSFWEALAPFAQASTEELMASGLSFDALDSLPTADPESIPATPPTKEAGLTEARMHFQVQETVEAQSPDPSEFASLPTETPVPKGEITPPPQSLATQHPASGSLGFWKFTAGVLALLLLCVGGWMLFQLGKQSQAPLVVRAKPTKKVVVVVRPTPPRPINQVVAIRKIISIPDSGAAQKQKPPKPKARKRTVRKRKARPLVRRRKRPYRLKKFVYARGDQGRTGDLHTRALWRAPRIKWQTKVNGFGRSTPVVAHGRVYIGNNRGVLRVLDRKTGDVKWEVMTRGRKLSRRSFARMTYSILGDLIYVTDFGQRVGIFNAHDGQLIREIPSRGSVQTAPLVYKRHIVFAAMYKNVFCFDRITKTRLWYRRENGRPVRTMARYHGTVLMGTEGGSLRLRHMADGKTFFSYEMQSSISAGPVISGDLAAAATRKGLVVGVDLKRRKVLWRRPLLGTIYYSLALSRGILVVMTYGKKKTHNAIYGLSLKRGKVLWTQPGTNPNTNPVIAGGVIYYGTKSGVVARRLKNGKFLWYKKLKEGTNAAPFVDDGVVYVSSMDGFVYALE